MCYSSITHDYDNWIVNDFFNQIRYTEDYPMKYPAGSSASFGTDMWIRAKADVYSWDIPMWVIINDSFSFALIDS